MSPTATGPPATLSALFERVASDAPCLVGIADSRFQPLFINAYGRRMTGLPDDVDVTTLSILDFFPRQHRKAIREVVLPTLLRDGIWEGEFPFHHFGGGAGANVKWNTFLLRGRAGEVIGAACFTTDLTERRDAEASLRESRARLKAAVDLVGLSSYAWNPQTGALQWDERLKALWGVPPGVEPNRALWLQGVHPDDRERVQAAADQAIDPDGEGIYAIQYRVIGLQGGPERWVYAYGQTEFDGRKPVAFTGAVLDITDQKRTEAQLRRNEARRRESDERFRTFAENSSDVIWILDAETRRLEYLSPGFQQTWALPPEAAIADIEVWNDCVHAEDRIARAQTLERVITHGESITYEYRIVRPDGSVRWIRETAFPIRNAEGRLGQIGGLAHDFSRREPLGVYVVEADLRAREEKAEALRRAGHQVTTFATESALLDVAVALASGCVFVRADDAGPARFALARALRARSIDLRVIFETELSDDVELAISAMKSGAADVLQAPVETGRMLAAVASALADVREDELEERSAQRARGQIAMMSQREREVLEGLLKGGTNKTIARELGISPRTVEIHRARVMERLGAHTVPEAVMAAASAGLRPSRSRHGMA